MRRPRAHPAATNSGSAPATARSPRSRRTTLPLRIVRRSPVSVAPAASTSRVSSTPPADLMISVGSIRPQCRPSRDAERPEAGYVDKPGSQHAHALAHFCRQWVQNWPGSEPSGGENRASSAFGNGQVLSPCRGGPGPARCRRRPAAARGCPSPAGTGGRRRGRGFRRPRSRVRRRPQRGP